MNLNMQGGKCKDKTHNAWECHNLCKETTDCNFFYWRGVVEPGRESECCLKGSGLNTLKDQIGAVSGPKSCGRL